MASSVSHRRSLLSCTGAVLIGLCLAQTPGAMARTPGSTVNAGAAQSGQSGSGGEAASASATLEQCVTAVAQAERSVTFSGEMTTIPGSVHMAMLIDVQEQLPGGAMFHTITAPGLGVWRAADPGVKTYKYVKQVTNLSAPAFYRAAMHFRWLNVRGHVIKAVEHHTSRCVQPAAPPNPSAASAASAFSPVAG
jgi:hypothetical protein